MWTLVRFIYEYICNIFMINVVEKTLEICVEMDQGGGKKYDFQLDWINWYSTFGSEPGFHVLAISEKGSSYL